jgi:hypothetical protein
MSDLGRCKTCKWWGRDYEGTCSFVDTTLSQYPDHFELECGADDDSGLWARLATGPEFGCVHHTPKDEEAS